MPRPEQRVFPMSRRDFQLPDDFPDLTLPEKSDPEPEAIDSPALPNLDPTATAIQPSLQAFRANLQIGDRVWAPWYSSVLFAGTVSRVEEKEVHIAYDDGRGAWVLREQVRPLEMPVGLRVRARLLMGGHFFPGKVIAAEGERVHIEYDTGDQEWTTPGALALPCEPFGPNARPTTVAMRRRPALAWALPVAIALVLALTRSGCH